MLKFNRVFWLAVTLALACDLVIGFWLREARSIPGWPALALAYLLLAFFGTVGTAMFLQLDSRYWPVRKLACGLAAAFLAAATIGVIAHIVYKRVVEESVSTLGWVELVASTSEMDGREYFAVLVNRAAEELACREVESRARSGRLVVEMVSPDTVAALILAEHEDPMAVDRYGDFFTALERDGSQAFANETSAAGARGLAQMMFGVAVDLIAAYPEAGLNDPGAIQEEHVSAVKAIFLLVDDQMARVPEKAARRMHTDAFRERAAAAAYNGGLRVFGAIERCGSAWRDTAECGLPRETRAHVEKFVRARNALEGGV